VVVVTGPGKERELAWTAEPVLTISPLEEEGNGFFGAQEVAVLEGSRIAVLDGDAKRVVVYDQNGAFQTQYGREGQGPGEFRMPFEMAAAPGGGVVVYDVLNARLEVFDSELEPQAPVRISVADYFGGHLAYADDFLVVPTRSSEDPERPVQGLTAANSRDTIPFVAFERAGGRVVTFESCGISLSGMGPIFEPTTLWAAGPGGMVAVAGTSRYEVDVYRAPDFSLERRIRRAVPVIRADADLAEATVGDGMRIMSPAGVLVCDASEVAEQRGFAPEVPPITGITVSPEGQIYLQRWAREEAERAIDVLSSQGEYLGTLPAGFPFPEAFLADGRIVAIKEDQMGLRSVVVYQVLR
jgi:hypothetical protein